MAEPPEVAAQLGSDAGRRVVELLWDPPEPAGRGPRQRLDLAQVITAAIDLADESGFEALSMRALARRLGVGAMSLYTYVPGRGELFELMIDRAYGEREIPSADLSWRQRYAGHARAALQMYRHHPWLVHSNLWRLPLGPRVMDISENLLAIGAAAGLSLELGVRVGSLLESYVFGMARGEIADRSEAVRTGETADEFWEARSSFWVTYFDAARYPMLFGTWQAGVYDQPDNPDNDLDFALDLILDSVERLLPRGNQATGNVEKSYSREIPQ